MSTLSIVHNAQKHRFEVQVEGDLAVATYELDGNVMALTHTLVPKPLEGRGIAAQLVAEALTHARQHGLRVRPVCSYVDAYMKRRPETHDLLAN